ncbi:MAG: glycosyltransferase family 39 protein [Deltaproteobacteria bacterium]|nr:glycosyltransferase family 39 protein [Deltaproteobacteria bacterium]
MSEGDQERPSTATRAELAAGREAACLRILAAGREAAGLRILAAGRWQALAPGSRHGLVGLGIALLAIGVQLPLYDRGIVPMDEGHHASVAMWLRHGKLLYRDLHTGIFPGIYHATAWLLGLFGDDLVVTRWAQLFTNVAMALLLWRTGLRAMRPGWALAAPLLYLALVPMSFPVLAMFNYSNLAVCLALGALLFLLRFREEARTGDALALGALIAACTLTKQNFGALVFLACLFGLLWGRRDSGLGERPLVGSLIPIAASGAGVALLVLLYFVATGTLDDFLYSTVIKLGGDQLESYNNPLPPVLGPHPLNDSRFIFLYTPPGLFNTMLHGERFLGLPVTAAVHSAAIRLSYGIPMAALLAAPWLLWLTRDLADALTRRAGVIIAVFAFVFSLGIFPSAIWSHLAFVMPPLLLLLGLVGDRLDRALGRRLPAAARGWRGLAAVTVAVASLVGVQHASKVARWNPTPLGLPRASLRVSPAQAEIYQSAMRFIDRCASPGEPIFVAPAMPILYFLSDRMNPTRYDLTIPGDVSGELIIEGLEQSQTRCIVYDPLMYPEFPPFEALFPEVARYVQSHYGRAAVIRGGDSRWLGLMRKSQGEP